MEKFRSQGKENLHDSERRETDKYGALRDVETRMSMLVRACSNLPYLTLKRRKETNRNT
jgi:hypothetical protein